MEVFFRPLGARSFFLWTIHPTASALGWTFSPLRGLTVHPMNCSQLGLRCDALRVFCRAASQNEASHWH